jgi:hypothetical protein
VRKILSVRADYSVFRLFRSQFPTHFVSVTFGTRPVPSRPHGYHADTLRDFIRSVDPFIDRLLNVECIALFTFLNKSVKVILSRDTVTVGEVQIGNWIY